MSIAVDRRQPAIDEQSMKRMPRLHEKPPPARLLMRVTSYPSEHKRIDLRRIPILAHSHTLNWLLQPSIRSPATTMGERFIAGSNVRRVTKHASRPAIDVLFSCRRAPGWEVPSIFTLPRDAGSSVRSGRLTPPGGSNQSVTRKQVQVRAALRRIGDVPKKPSVPRRLPGPVRASGRIVARLDRSAALHGRAILAKAELPIFWPPAQPNAIL